MKSLTVPILGALVSLCCGCGVKPKASEPCVQTSELLSEIEHSNIKEGYTLRYLGDSVCACNLHLVSDIEKRILPVKVDCADPIGPLFYLACTEALIIPYDNNLSCLRIENVEFTSPECEYAVTFEVERVQDSSWVMCRCHSLSTGAIIERKILDWGFCGSVRACIDHVVCDRDEIEIECRNKFDGVTKLQIGLPKE
jgi:hypothetical protein